ncbi:MAG: Gfo/Idh/MocA family oxidoreductase [Kiritimatiellaeota bacterium]|nr:Gfo/Idh/MocA family oxidoreductase [Kiritimatiellota bacterium]
MKEARKPQIEMSRRGFLGKGAALAGAALGFPTIVPAAALGKAGRPAPSNRIVMGVVGVGLQGMDNLRSFLGFRQVQMVAVCDVDARHLAAGKHAVDRRYGNRACRAVRDFREITGRDGVDAVCIATPDHWHVLPALDAVRHGKDAYVQKPLTLTISEGRMLADAVYRYGAVVQTGSQQRSSYRFRHACELVRNGRLGQIHTVRVGIPGNNKRCGPTWNPEPVPPELDYESWLGPAPWAPYHHQRCHYQFRFILDYSGGQVTNWGAHHLDIAQWGLGTDRSGPVEISGHGEFPETGLFTTATKVYFECRYSSGTRLICSTGGGGVVFEGNRGALRVDRGRLTADPPSLLKEVIGPGEIRLYESRNHFANFLECVRTRRPPICDAEIGHRSATMCHLGNIAMLLGRKLKWDPTREEFPDDDEANRLRSRVPRPPWRYV